MSIRAHRAITPFAIAPLLLAGLACAAVPVSTTIDPNQSKLTVEINLPLGSDSDESPTSGTIDIELDDAGNPAAVTLFDLQAVLDETIDLSINTGLFGAFNATGTSISVRYADAPTPLGPVPVDAMGDATFLAVPFATDGIVAYTATGLICAGLQGQSLPCSDTIDLALEPNNSGDIDGNVTVVGSTVTLTAALDVTVPLDPMDPGLGSFRVFGTIVATGEADSPPCVADVTTTGTSNGVPDGVVDLSDFSFFLSLWSAGSPSADVTTSGTSNGVPDGTVDLSDFSVYLSLWSAGCP